MYMGQEAPLRVGKFRVIFWGACAQPPVAPASMMASVASLVLARPVLARLVLARLVLEIMSACSFRPDPCRNYIVMLRVNRIFLHAGKPPGFSSSHPGAPAKIALRIKNAGRSSRRPEGDRCPPGDATPAPRIRPHP